MISKNKRISYLNHLDDNVLDFLLVICKKVLDKISAGKKLYYFEKKAGNILDNIFQIKQDRIINPGL